MSGYYSFQLTVPQVVTLTYNLSVEVKQVDVDATILETIYPDSDDQTTGKSVGLQTGQECLFADIVYNSNVTHDYMFLEVNVEPCLDAGIGVFATFCSPAIGGFFCTYLLRNVEPNC